MNTTNSVENILSVDCPVCGKLKTYKTIKGYNKCKTKPCKSCANSLKNGGDGNIHPFDGLKKCIKCDEVKSVDFFHRYKKTNRYHSLCMECKKQAFRNYQKEFGRFARHGITKNDYEEMYKEQNGECFTCGVNYDVLYIDHNHTTGLVRKLLCRDCNSALGLLKENKKTINNLIKYLENYGNI